MGIYSELRQANLSCKGIVLTTLLRGQYDTSMSATSPSIASMFSPFTSALRQLKIIVLVFLGLFLFRSTLIFVPAGHVGVVYDRGRGVLPHAMKEGLNFAIPVWQHVTLFDTRIQEYTMSAAVDEGALRRDDSLDAPTSDGQQVKVDATVLFKVNGDKAPELYKTVGEDYVDKIIRPFSRSQIRMVISRYSAPSIYSEKRQEAETVMTNELADMLAAKNLIFG